MGGQHNLLRECGVLNIHMVMFINQENDLNLFIKNVVWNL